MKKLICFVLTLAVLCSCLTACSFTKNLSGAFAGEAEATPKVKQMMTALATNNISEAKALLHPEAAETSDAAIEQMSAFLDGREVDSMEQENIKVNTSTGTSGKTRQEQVVFRVTLTDGAVIYLNVFYYSDKSGTGFISFQLVLGIV